MKSMRWFALAASAAVMLGSSVANAQAKLPLVTFFSPGRNDFITTSDPEWTCTYYRDCRDGRLTPPEPSYLIVGLQGHVWNPALPAPAGTVPLYHWYNGTISDNFLTTNPAWAGRVGDVRDGWWLHRIEGYIIPGGTAALALRTFFSETRVDNATVTDSVALPSHYTHVRNEGTLLPPPADFSCTGPVHEFRWFARANYVETWPAPSGLIGGDRFQFTAAAEYYYFDFWGHVWPSRGYSWGIAPAGFPAPGLRLRALIARVTAGRVFDGWKWIEANTWFEALGNQGDDSGRCYLYDSTGAPGGRLEAMVNDDSLGDNTDGTDLKMKQWFAFE
ncbi:MAG: hypothetical protein ACOZQL_25380 [Myxococcota bacterium]